jgi:hypothetical protein
MVRLCLGLYEKLPYSQEGIVKNLFVYMTMIGILLFAQQSLAVTVYMKGIDLQRISEADEKITSGKINIETASDSSEFMGYVIGFFDAAIVFGALCPQMEATRGQLMAIVIKYIKNNPERWNKAGADLVIDALMPVFSCKQK